jgi:GNAT superfamily N-acetyltransferase
VRRLVPDPTTEPADIGLSFALGDGLVSLRPLGPGDLTALAGFFAALTAEGRRTRFFSATHEVPPAILRYLVDVDQVDHLAWGAFIGSRCVGEVRAVRTRADAGQAEIAFAVADDVRRIGLGRLLIETIGVAGATVGIERFCASVLADNRSSGLLLAGLGMRFRFEDGARVGTGPVPSWRGSTTQARAIDQLARRAATSALGRAA